jgi:ATP-dependent Clp protease, protease subunit
MDYKQERSVLAQKRQLLILGDINGDVCDYIVSTLRVFNIESETEPIILWIDSPGGRADLGLNIYDNIKFSIAPVYAVVTYQAASMATIILQACTKRFILPNSKILVHGIYNRQTKLQDLMDDAQKIIDDALAIQDRIYEILHLHCQLGKDKWLEFCRKDTNLTAEQALELKLVDHIVATREIFLKEISS